jgi:hypothetical protein
MNETGSLERFKAELGLPQEDDLPVILLDREMLGTEKQRCTSKGKQN